jgi:hypothetical protein
MPDIRNDLTRDDNTLDEESFFAKDDGAPVKDGTVAEGAEISVPSPIGFIEVDEVVTPEPEPEPETPKPAPKRRARKPKAKTSARKEKK